MDPGLVELYMEEGWESPALGGRWGGERWVKLEGLELVGNIIGLCPK